MISSWNNYINKKFGARILSKWVVLCFDIVITIFTYFLAYILRYNFNIETISFNEFINDSALITIIYSISFIAFKSYDGIIRHSGIADAIRLIKSGLTGTFLAILLSLLSGYYNWEKGMLPISISIIHAVLLISILLFSRYGIKVFFYQINRNKIKAIPVIIYGAGRRGLSVLQALRADAHNNYSIVAFLDDNISKIDKTIEGIKIYDPSKFASLAMKFEVEELIIGIHDFESNKKNAIVNTSLSCQVVVKSVPPMHEWINGRLSPLQIKNIEIEDLLGRSQIQLNNNEIKTTILGKIILISGAAGSIGSELVRQLILFNPKQLILVDQAESALFDLKMDLFFKLKAPLSIDIQYIVCDITNFARLNYIFNTYKPELVFHAAAYKHVPLMESNVQEAAHVNIIGTKHLVDLAIKFNISKFVLISTDKAVNPTNVMGATKRAAEIYVQDQSKRDGINTIFITTRFGNVLGSNGSVVNYFKMQIENGGPLTITHPEVTRYFMTISEACQLVLEAAVMGKTSELYLFDMGEPVKIVDLAKKMVQLSGLEPETDIPFLYTGLRPGEKLHEELLNDNEKTLPTHHQKIKIAITTQHTHAAVEAFMTKLVQSLETQEAEETVTTLKELIPEFISKNSTFERLDS